MTHVAFFGDGERTFTLTPELIMELERKTSVGIAVLCRRVFAQQFVLADLVETIRLALIGGGVSPKEAADLVATCAASRPLAETLPLAVAILETVFFGSATKLDADNG